MKDTVPSPNINLKKTEKYYFSGTTLSSTYPKRIHKEERFYFLSVLRLHSLV
jgi:hypothetical protein